MGLRRSLGGMVEVELVSADLEKTFQRFNENGIEITNVILRDELTCGFQIQQSSYPALKQLCVSGGEKLYIKRKSGIRMITKQISSRPVLMLGLVTLMMLAIWMPTSVLFVGVDGNLSVPENQILEAAENCGISFGASRREVRSEKMKNALLAELPQLQWAGINTYGCTAQISVRERAVPETTSWKQEITGIAASRDGYILSCTVTRGTGLVQPGNSVKEGQMLISAYTDCGLCIRAEPAEGEVIAQTNRGLTSITPIEYVKTVDTGSVKRKVSLLIRKKRIFLWKDSGIWDTTCGRMYEEYYVTLPGGFQLPVALCVEVYTDREKDSVEMLEEDAVDKLVAFSEHYLSQHMVAGEILSMTHATTSRDGVCRMESNFVCREMIGTRKQEQIGDTNGEND